MFVHCRRIAARHDDRGSGALHRADGPEQISGCRSLIFRRAGAGSAFGPSPGEGVFLAHTRLILPPQLYRRAGFELFGDFRQRGGEVFLKVAIACGSWA